MSLILFISTAAVNWHCYNIDAEGEDIKTCSCFLDLKCIWCEDPWCSRGLFWSNLYDQQVASVVRWIGGLVCNRLHFIFSLGVLKTKITRFVVFNYTCASKCYHKLLIFFRSIHKSHLREWPKLELRTIHDAVECSTDCAIAAWESVFLFRISRERNISFLLIWM